MIRMQTTPSFSRLTTWPTKWEILIKQLSMLNHRITVSLQLLQVINSQERKISKTSPHQLMVLIKANIMLNKFSRDRKMLVSRLLPLTRILTKVIFQIILKEWIQIWSALLMEKTHTSINFFKEILTQRFKKISSTDSKSNIWKREILDQTQEVWALVTTSESDNQLRWDSNRPTIRSREALFHKRLQHLWRMLSWNIWKICHTTLSPVISHH